MLRGVEKMNCKQCGKPIGMVHHCLTPKDTNNWIEWLIVAIVFGLLLLYYSFTAEAMHKPVFVIGVPTVIGGEFNMNNFYSQ